MSYSLKKKYHVVLSKSAAKEFRRLPERAQQAIKQQLQRLEVDPGVGKKLKGELTGYFSLRVWPYRILYRVDNRQCWVYIYRIAHRQGVYR